MDRLRRSLIVTLGLAPIAARAQLSAHSPRPGQDYTVLQPAQPVDTPPGKVDVIEFFWYGCPHCYALEPRLERWVAGQPADVDFRPVPAIFSQGWVPDAKVFYAFEALGVRKRLQLPFFNAIHEDHLQINDRAAFEQWLRRHNVDPMKFGQAVTSFGVQSAVRRAADMTVAYRIGGVPTLAIQGRYTVSAAQSHTGNEARAFRIMLDTADYLIGQARQQTRVGS